MGHIELGSRKSNWLFCFSGRESNCQKSKKNFNLVCMGNVDVSSPDSDVREADHRGTVQDTVMIVILVHHVVLLTQQAALLSEKIDRQDRRIALCSQKTTQVDNILSLFYFNFYVLVFITLFVLFFVMHQLMIMQMQLDKHELSK